MLLLADSVKYLRHTVKPGSQNIDETRVKSFNLRQLLRHVAKLWSLFGLCNLYQRFVPHYTEIAARLNKFLQKGQPKNSPTLDDHESQTKGKRVQIRSSKPVLALPRPELPFVIDTDTGEYQLGAALLQVYPDGYRKPIGFLSRSLNSNE